MAEKAGKGRKVPAEKKRKLPTVTGAKKATKARAKAPAKARKRASRRADKAVAVAKANGATGRHLGATKQGLRDSAIMQRVAQGVRYATIAAQMEVSVRTVEQVVHNTRALRSPMEATPMELFEGLARGFELSIGDFEAMSYAFIDSSPGDAIRAKRNANDARRAFAELMAHVGKLPTDLEVFRSESEMQQLRERMLDVMEQLIAGDVTPAEAFEFWQGLTLRPRELAVDSTAVEE